MWKELEVVGYRANRMQCSHVHGGFLQGFGTPLAFCLWEVLVCVGGIFQVPSSSYNEERGIRRKAHELEQSGASS